MCKQCGFALNPHSAATILYFLSTSIAKYPPNTRESSSS